MNNEKKQSPTLKEIKKEFDSFRSSQPGPRYYYPDGLKQMVVAASQEGLPPTEVRKAASLSQAVFYRWKKALPLSVKALTVIEPKNNILSIPASDDFESGKNQAAKIVLGQVFNKVRADFWDLPSQYFLHFIDLTRIHHGLLLRGTQISCHR